MRRGARVVVALLLVSACKDASIPPNTVDLGEAVLHSKHGRVIYPADNLPTLLLSDGERQPVKSMLNTPQPLKFGDYVWNDDDVPAGPRWVRIDLSRQTLSIFRAGHEIGSAVILFGETTKPTPVGVFPILQKKTEHRSTLYDADMPYMLRLTGDGVAVHASNVRPGAATHGCIGVPLAFARLLYDQVELRDRVAIVRS